MLRLVVNNNLSDYDPLIPDEYLSRVAAASERCGICASEDILSDTHVVLVKKDVRFTPEMASALFSQRLHKPIEYVIYLTHSLDESALESLFGKILKDDIFFVALSEHQDLMALAKPYWAALLQHPLLVQKLTVMSVAMPKFFVRSVYCTWFSLLIAKEMHFSEDTCTDIFLAAISHDIGMLHISNTVLDKQGALTSDDWRHIQSHVDIGKYWLSKMENLPTDVISAVYEHHERCDGTGYPKGIVESELTYGGKIVGLADSLVAIYQNRFTDFNRSWNNAIGIIKMNAQAYFFRHEEILEAIWRRSELPYKNVVQGDSLPEFVSRLAEQHQRLTSWFEVLRDSLLSIGFTHQDRKLHSLQNIMLHVTTSAKGSGIFELEIDRLQQMQGGAQTEQLFKEIEHAHVQQTEMQFHLQRLDRMMQLYIDSNEIKNAEIKRVLLVALAQSKKFME